MGLFDSFRAPPPLHHPTLGSLLYSGGRWRGTIVIESGTPVPLLVPGARSAPDPNALQTASQALAWWSRVRAIVEKELYNHYDAGRDGGIPALPGLATPTDVWSHVTLSSVEIGPYRSMNELQIAIRTAWDDEHTLGALVRDAVLIELNGSILEPR